MKTIIIFEHFGATEWKLIQKRKRVIASELYVPTDNTINSCTWDNNISSELWREMTN